MSNLEHLDKKLQIVEGASVQEKEKPSTSSMSGDRPQRRGGRRPGRRGGKMDERAKLERSRQSARECRARKKLRYQYLEDLVANREKAVFALRDELELYKQWCIQMDKGLIPLGLLKLCGDSVESDQDEKEMVSEVIADSNSDRLKPMKTTDSNESSTTDHHIGKGDKSCLSNLPPFVSSNVSDNNNSKESTTQPSASQIKTNENKSNQNVYALISSEASYKVDSSGNLTQSIPNPSSNSPVASGSKEEDAVTKRDKQLDNILAMTSIGATGFEFGKLDENLKDMSDDAKEFDVIENMFDSADEELDLDNMESVRKFLMKQMQRKTATLPTIVEENEV